METEKLRIAREKLTRVFRYLEALNQHRNPAKRQIREQLWHFWLHDLPVHPAVKRGVTKSKSAKAADTNSHGTDADASGWANNAGNAPHRCSQRCFTPRRRQSHALLNGPSSKGTNLPAFDSADFGEVGDQRLGQTIGEIFLHEAFLTARTIRTLL